MLDVHPPHPAAHSWRDFFIQIVTIAVGLLLAIGLEQTVEYIHHRHLLHQAESNLRNENQDNRQTLADNEKLLDGTEAEMQTNLRVFADLKAHRNPAEQFSLQWKWTGLQSAAWDTARNTGAVGLMSYDSAQDYSIVYSQQTLVNEQAWVYIRDVYRSGTNIALHKLPDLEPAEIDSAIADTKQTLNDIRYLRDLIRGLRVIYDEREPSSR